MEFQEFVKRQQGFQGFQEFVKQQQRMCSYRDCKECEIYEQICANQPCEDWMMLNSKAAEEIVLRWAHENPIITNGDKFKEIFDTSFRAAVNVWTDIEKVEIGGMSILDWSDAEYKPPREKS